MVHVDLVGPQQREQLAGERPHHGLRLGGAIGEPHQAAQAREQRIARRRS